MTEALIPFSIDDFRILSARPDIRTRKRSQGYFYSGVLSSIYQEALVAFAMLDQPESGRRILIAATTEDKFMIKSDERGIELSCQDTLFASIDAATGSLTDVSGNVMAEIIDDEDNTGYKINVNNQTVAFVNKYAGGEAKESDRFFSLFHEFSAEPNRVFIAVSLYLVFFSDSSLTTGYSE